MKSSEGSVPPVSAGLAPSRRASSRPVHPASALALLAMVCFAFPLLTTLATPSNGSAQEWQRAQARARAEELQRLSEEQAREMRAHAHEVRVRAEQIRRLSEEEAVEARLRAGELQRLSEDRARELRLQARDLAGRAQQIVIRAQARVRLGVELDPDQGPEYDRQGVRVKGLLAESPAGKAGLRKDDIITHLNGLSLVEPLPDSNREDGLRRSESLPVQRLMELARDTEPGDQIEVRFLRNGRPETATFEAEEVGGGQGLTILPRTSGVRERILRIPEIHLDTLRIREQIIRVPELRFDTEFPFDSLRGRVLHFDTEFPFDSLRGGVFHFDTEFPFDSLRGGVLRGFALGDPQEPWVSMVYGRRLQGMELREMNPDLAHYFSTDAGVLVLDVDEEGELGLRAGDVILAIGDREVESVRDVRRILASYRDEERVTFQVMRQGRRIQVEGRMD